MPMWFSLYSVHLAVVVVVEDAAVVAVVEGAAVVVAA